MFHGSIVALVTPMDKQDVVDVAALQRLIDWHLEQGTDGLVVLGTTGETSTIHESERKFVIENVIHYVEGRIPVIVGTGSNSTDLTIQHTHEAMKYGADACLLVTPYYNKPTQEGLYLHYKAVADAVPIPQILYNVPGRTACDILPETVARLAKLSNVIGIKEATGNLDRLKEILALTDGKIDLYSGDDATAMDFILQGGKGVISVTANVAPRLMHEMCKAALAGNRDKAKELDGKLEHLHRDLFLEANPIPVKWALNAMGIIPEGIRLPLTPLSERYRETVKKALEYAGLIS